jgi:hypothetical protein
MSGDKGDNPWDERLGDLSPTSSDAEDDTQVDGFMLASGDNDLATDLDLSRREDRATVKETPFTLAKLRAQKQASKNAGAETRRGGAIRPAHEEEPSSTSNATAGPSAPKKRKAPNTGWTDSNGVALDARPLSKKGKRGVQSEVKRPPAPPRTVHPLPPKPTKAPAKRKGKRKKDDEDKVEFRVLRELGSSFVS